MDIVSYVMGQRSVESGGGSTGGVQLYGQYVFTNSNSITIAAGDEDYISLDQIFDPDFNTEYDFPPLDSGVKFLMAEFSGYPLCVTATISLGIYQGAWDGPGIQVLNTSDSSVTCNARQLQIRAYTTVELPQKQS